MKEMLQCFKDAHIPHIVNENTLDLIMSYCDKTGDGEIDYNELAGLIMTGDILGRSRWLRAASRQRHSPACLR